MDTIRNKDGDYLMLNILRESQGGTNPFKSSKENIKHGTFTLGWNIALDLKGQRMKKKSKKSDTISLMYILSFSSD